MSCWTPFPTGVHEKYAEKESQKVQECRWSSLDEGQIRQWRLSPQPRRLNKARPHTPITLRHTTELLDSASTAWQTNYTSITQESDLEAFLSTAQLAGTEFTAERLNVQVLDPKDQSNIFVLDPDTLAKTESSHKTHSDKLSIPRRVYILFDNNSRPGIRRLLLLSWIRQNVSHSSTGDGVLSCSRKSWSSS